MFCNWLVFACFSQFLKCYNALSCKLFSIKSKLNLNFHFLGISNKCVLTCYLFTINDKLCIAVFKHLNTGKCIFLTNFKSFKSYCINDSYIFIWIKFFFTVNACCISMNVNYSCLNSNCLTFIINILVFCNLFRIIWVSYIFKFFKSYKVFTA